MDPGVVISKDRLGWIALVGGVWSAFVFGCGEDDGPTEPEDTHLSVALSLASPAVIEGTLAFRAIRTATEPETTRLERALSGSFTTLELQLELEPGSYSLLAEIQGVEQRALGGTGPGLLHQGSRSLALAAGEGATEIALATLVPEPALTIEGDHYLIAWDPIPEAAAYEIREETTSLVRDVIGTQALFDFPPSARGGAEELSYRVRARLADVASAYSERIAVSLPPQVPPDAVSDLHVVDEFTAPTRLALGWTAPGDDGNVGTADRYDLRWSLAPIDEANFDQLPPGLEGTPRPAGSAELYILEHLTPQTRYYCALITSDEAGNRSGLSNVVLDSTAAPPDSLPPETIDDLAAVPIDENRVQLTWTAPADDGGRAFAYELRYDTQPIALETFPDLPQIATPAPLDPGLEESVIAGDLRRETLYYFAVRSLDEDGNASALSNEANAITPDLTAPGRVQTLVARQVGPTFVLLNWTAVGDDGTTGTAAAYDLRRSSTPLDESSFELAEPVPDVPAPQPAGAAERLQVDGLAPSTSYYFALRVVDESGNRSQVSNVVHATTSR